MENILIVVGILILGSAMGGTQLPKLPGAVLSLGALFSWLPARRAAKMESLVIED